MASEASSTILETICDLLIRVFHDIWTSPINLILVILIVILVVKLFSLKSKPSYQHTPAKQPVQLPKMPKADLTVEELLRYNGKDSNGRILTAIYGDIFDVSRRKDLYGPGGAYSLFAGRDATRALAKMELTQSLFKDEYDDIEDLTSGEKFNARNWHEDFRDKYDIVGRLLKPGETPSVYPAEESTADGTNVNDDTKKKE